MICTMGHHLCALVLTGPVDAARGAARDLRALLVHGDVSVYPIDHYYSAYWAAIRADRARLDLPDDLAAIFPAEAVLLDLVREVTRSSEPRFAIILTDYFGGAGCQWAVAFQGTRRLTGDQTSVNAALRALGVRAVPPADEFDTVGLGAHRHNPEYLDRYQDLCDRLGV